MAHTGEGDSDRIPRRSVLAGLGGFGMAGAAGCISTDIGIDLDSDPERLIFEGFQEAGVEPPVETTIYSNAETEGRKRWAQLVQHELDGTDLFDVEFETLEWTSYIDLVNNMAANEENALVCLGFIGGWDPHQYVYPGFHSDSFAPTGLNINHYENERVDELIDEGVATVDGDERVAIYEELQELLVKESPLSFVRAPEEIVTYRADAIDGFRTYPVPGDEYKSIYAPTLGVYTELTTDETELVGDAGTKIDSYDPVRAADDVSYMATGLLYEQLLEIDFDGSARPLLATDWHRIDETTWRFDLREGVQFHTGEPFTAADVRATLERYEGSPSEQDVYNWYESAEILGDHEIEISLRRPYGPLETAIAQVPILPKAVADGTHDITERPVGTGPYAFEEHEPATLWRLVANEDHWHDGSNGVPETPPIETVTMRIVTESSARRGALEAGDIHLTTGLPNESLETFEADDAFVVDRTTGAAVDFLGYPSYREPFSNPKVRRGIGQLIPRERIIEDVFHGAGTVAYTPISPTHETFVGPEFEARIVEEYFS
ncbi:extracellular solute-binding protein family 5 [Haloterrigena turkmenica DSM 5511]|uniref:Extracellular solute-binding protein family 5 n=1 Tax=Haloterrigena turkmenica (strain ATCC 51198 / DSM 5511 / JCM 9101 / NCIMB 13204 / VKM B-1734 / 4k) TaxID=543526 RepID=D2RXU4_HALTV|nr:ABC transporter substrate-binding protein [Haloterrigena turkmenica]ADB59778.1 extracellular solute-binding protein family 5 [Haloterrigena turkmenica DSM 5511]